MKRLLIAFLFVPSTALAQDPHLDTVVDAIAADVLSISTKMDRIIDLLQVQQGLLWAVLGAISMLALLGIWLGRRG